MKAKASVPLGKLSLKSKTPEPNLLELSRPAGSCCGAQPERARFTPANVPDYETYKLTATYYTLREGLTATLMLNNKGPEAILATPTFYSLAGTRLRLAPITVPATSYIDVDMHDVLAGADDEFREGSLKISYQGISQQLGAQVKLVDGENSLIWAEQLVYTTKYVSSRLESVWWRPYEDSQTRVVFSNTSSGSVTATITADGTSPVQSSPLIISLNPWETRVFDTMADIVGHPNGHIQEKGGISISHTGAPGAVLARMFIAAPAKGYSAAVQFIDPNATVLQRWHGNGLRLRNLNGNRVDPVFVARNNGAEASRIHAKIHFTRSDGSQGFVDIPERTIPAGSTRKIDLSDFIEDAEVPGSITFGGIEVEYDTPRGSVVTSVQSVSRNGNHVFQVPMFDPANIPSSAGGFPWKVDGDYTTIVYIKNETGQPRKYSARLKYPGGVYSLRESEIAPHQTVAVDFRSLRDSQTPGVGNLVIPLDAVYGQIGWSMIGTENKTLSARSEQISLSGAVASTYSCANCCPSSRFYDTVNPAFAETPPGSNMQYFTIGIMTDCMQNTTPIEGGASWTSLNSAIATVDNYSGLAQAVSPGTTSITGDWMNFSWLDAGQQCWYNEYPGQGSGDIGVVGVQKVQYKGPNNDAFSDVANPLYVLKGSQINFKAIPNPSTATFPSGQPVWAGTSGATGTGTTTSVTFNTVSSSTGDYKTVVATAGNSSVTVNVVVYELTGTLNPQVFFTGRSFERYGLKEEVNLGFLAFPSVSDSQMGGLTWKVISGSGTIPANSDGTETYTAGAVAGEETLKLEVITGPSKGLGPIYTRTIVAPSDGYIRQTPGSSILHCQGYCSVGFYGEARLQPTDVSFSKLWFREGGGTAQASGFYGASAGAQHQPTNIMIPITDCNFTLGCMGLDADLIGTYSSNTSFATGSLTWPIEWRYGLTDSILGSQTGFTTASHHQTSTDTGTANIQKEGSGTFSRTADSASSSCEILENVPTGPISQDIYPFKFRR